MNLPTTINGCDLVLDELDHALKFQRQVYDFYEKTEASLQHHKEMTRLQLNITRNQMNENELRKKELIKAKNDNYLHGMS